MLFLRRTSPLGANVAATELEPREKWGARKFTGFGSCLKWLEVVYITLIDDNGEFTFSLRSSFGLQICDNLEDRLREVIARGA